MTDSSLRWPTYFTLAAYTLFAKVLPYALPLVGVAVDPTLNTYPWNFSPVLAFCLFGGAVLPQRSTSLWAPLLIWLLGDLGIWAVTGRRDWAFYPALGIVYCALLLCSACGWWLRRGRTWWSVTGLALLTPWLFFLITNGACWIGNSRFPQTLAGLGECLAAGLPFHRNLVVSTLVFAGLMFSPLGVRAAVPSNGTEELQPAAVH